MSNIVYSESIFIYLVDNEKNGRFFLNCVFQTQTKRKFFNAFYDSLKMLNTHIVFAHNRCLTVALAYIHISLGEIQPETLTFIFIT